MALALAVASLVAAVVGALGPADAVRSTYSWPPRDLPAETPSRLWYTPLLLSRQEPESVSVRVPCSLPPLLPGAEQPATVVATARVPQTSGGLAVTHAGGQLTVSVGEQVLGTVTVPAGAGAGESCAYDLQFAAGRWAIEGGPDAVSLTGSLERMPVVFGLFSGLDLRSPGAPTVDVTTDVHDTQTTLLQTIAWILAVVGIVAALVLVVVPVGPRNALARVRAGLAGAVGHAHVADAVVAVTLAVWWIVAPVVWDDGWVVARERTFAESGGFSTYYSALGVDLPLDYWVEWLHHWLAEHTSTVLLLRLPALVLLAVLWVLCRWTFSRLTQSSPRRWDAGLWALASAFLVGALAWNMAIRPEPVTALLATGVAACAVRFVERESVAPVAIAAFLVPLALTAHHTGIVSLAPLLAVSPLLVRWSRPRLVAAGALVVASISWCVVLGFVGSDVGQRLADARTTSELGITSSWRDEVLRYAYLRDFPWATPLRRASVALIALALLAYVSRRRDGRRPLDLPATMLGISLVLLIVTPSKVPWHFGALTGLLALAVGAEVARLRGEGAGSHGWRLRPFLVIGAVVVAAAWSWVPRYNWNPLDLRTLSWSPGGAVAFSAFAIVLPAIVLGGALLVGVRRGRRFGGAATPWRVAAWTAPMLAGPLILFTVGVLAGDFRRTDGWTLTRQNVDSIVGRSGCGLADDTVASLWNSARPLTVLGAARSVAPGPWVPAAPVTGVPRFELSSSASTTPWFRLPADKRLGLFVAGSGVFGGSVALEWGRMRGGQIEPIRSDVVSDVQPMVETVDTAPWTFVAASELPPADPQANLVRIATPQSVAPRAPVAVTAPVTYRTEPLSRLFARREARALIHPNLLLYFPCARQPRLAAGMVEAPRYLVWFAHHFQPHPFEPTSPFLGARDLYPVQRLPLTDGTNPPLDVVVHEIDRRIPGAEPAAPDSDGS